MKKVRKNRKGFTLLEVLIAVVLIGIGIAGIVAANGSLTKLNGAAVDLSTAEFLAEQIREMTAQMNFSSLNSLNNKNYCPPRDSQDQALNDFSDYTQSITAVHVQNDDLTQVSGNSTNYIRITVDIVRDSKTITSASWIRANYE